MKSYAVTGRPIGFSRSPDLFNTAFSRLALDAAYTRLAAESAAGAVRTMKEAGLDGMNVTAPFKEAVVGHLDALDETVEATGAANTIVNTAGRAAGFNTDPRGVTGALAGAGVDPNGRRALVLGAGGAARSAVFALRAAGASDVAVANRGAERAMSLSVAQGCRCAPLQELRREVDAAEIVVSCLPAGARLVEPEWLKKGQVVLEANYAGPDLAEAARKTGCLYVSGIDWLVWQAAAGFELLTGRPAPVAAMREAAAPRHSSVPARRTGVALVGFMGAGKSAVGEIVARRLGAAWFDTDREIERRANRSIAEVFASQGEASFRERETEALQAIDPRGGVVVTTGGGAVLSEHNRRLLAERCTVVWLWAPLDTCLARAEKSSRPLLAGRSRESIAGLFETRQPLYVRASDLMVDAGTSTSDEVAERIIGEVRFPIDS